MTPMTIIERTIRFWKLGYKALLTGPEADVWNVMNAFASAESQEAFPALQTIAEKLGLKINEKTGKRDTRNVRDALRGLVAKGFLVAVRPSSHTSSAVYKVTLPVRGGLEPGEGDRPTQGEAPAGGSETRDEGVLDHTLRGVSDPPKRVFKRVIKSAHTQGVSAFDRFASEFPRHKHIGLPAARSIWVGQDLDDDVEAILAGLARWKRSPEWQREQGRYIPRPAAFLADQQWLADPCPQTPAAARPPPAKGVSLSDIDQHRAQVDVALAAMDAWKLEQLKREVIERSGDAGRTFEHVDPTDTKSPRAALLRMRIADLTRSKRDVA